MLCVTYYVFLLHTSVVVTLLYGGGVHINFLPTRFFLGGGRDLTILCFEKTQVERARKTEKNFKNASDFVI